MSAEQLLFFLILVAIPLLERLFRTRRTRTDGSPAKDAPAPAETTVSPPRAPVSVRDAGTPESGGAVAERPLPEASLPPAVPQEVRHAPRMQRPALEREPRIGGERTHGPATIVRARRSARPLVARRVIAAGDLRRAIVWIAILGPCRALDPHDAPQRV